MKFHEVEGSGYPVKYDRPAKKQNLSLLGQMKQGYSELKKQTGLFLDECIEVLKLDPVRIWRTGEVDVMWRFNDNPECLNNWVITSDKDWNEGFSEVNLQLSSHGKGVFSGFVNQTVIKSGTISAAGYCNIKTVPKFKSFYREVKHEWLPYTHLVMRIRGDGRGYIIILNCKGYYDIHWNNLYTYPLYTRGGPYWQIVRIPFSKFFLSSKGAIQDDQIRIDLTEISNFGITAAKFNGPFKLEIDWIGCEYDDSEWEEFAYEKYNTDGIMF